MIDFIIHNVDDSIGTIVVENMSANKSLLGWVMENDSDVEVNVSEMIPIGHKVAVKDIQEGDTIFKYGEDIGRAIAFIPKGGYVHVHNVKTKRW